MTTFAYSSGNPANLTGGATASMNDIKGPLDDIPTFLNGNVDATNLSAAAATFLGLSQSGAVRRGKSIIATEEARTNTAYGTLTTPDQVASVVLPTDGLMIVTYQAQWKNSVASAGRAAIFLGANQLQKSVTTLAAPSVDEATGDATINSYRPVGSTARGLVSQGTTGGVAYTGDVTTGQIVSPGADIAATQTGVCVIFAAAGTYTVSIQFKSASGSVTVKERKLWVETKGF